MGGSRTFIRRLAARLRSSTTVELPHLRTHCPLCGIRVVEARYVSMQLAASFGPSPCWTFSDDELIDMCPLHRLLEGAAVGGGDPA